MTIVVVTCWIVDERTKERAHVVSHGVDIDTGQRHCLPPEKVERFRMRQGVRFDPCLGELVLDDEQLRMTP